MNLAVLIIGGITATIALFLVLVLERDNAPPAQPNSISRPVPPPTLGDSSGEGAAIVPHSGQPAIVPVDEVESTENQRTPAFFSEVSTERLDQDLLEYFLSSHPVQRFRTVTVNSDAFRTIIRDASPDQNTLIQLFDDVVVTVAPLRSREYVDGQFSGHATWIARISNEPAGVAQVMVDPAGNVDASFRSSSGAYKLESLGGSAYHVIWQRDPSVSIDTD